MKNKLIQVRAEAALKRAFESASRFNHQTLSQFLVQAGMAAVEQARAKGLGIKQPATPRDGRRKAVK